jgi:hypothetical protein
MIATSLSFNACAAAVDVTTLTSAPTSVNASARPAPNMAWPLSVGG